MGGTAIRAHEARTKGSMSGMEDVAGMRTVAAARGFAYVLVPWSGLLLAPVPDKAVSVGVLAALTVVSVTLLALDAAADRAVLLAVAAFTLCDLSPLSFEGSVVRLYQLSAPLVLVIVVRRRRALWDALVRLSGLSALVLGLVLTITALTALSLLWTISATQTVVSTVGQLSATALFLLVTAAVAAGLVSGRQVLAALWVMASAGSGVAIAQFLLTVLTPLDLAESGGSGIPWPRPSGLMTESVWAALAAATGLGLAFAFRRSHAVAAWTTVGLHLATLALVMSRAVLLGMLVGGVLVVVVAGRRHLTVRRVAAAAIVATVAVSVVAVVAPALVQRFDPRLILGLRESTDGGSAASRGAVYRLVADELPDHLPLGAGAGSLHELTTDPEIRERYLDGGELNSGRGSTNLFLGFTFDFGPLGTVVIVSLVVLVLVMGLRLSSRDGGLTLYLTGLYLVDFQFNNGLRFGFVHVLLGLAVATWSSWSDRPGPDRSSAARVPDDDRDVGITTNTSRSSDRR